MNRIDESFTRLKRSGRKALIGYVTAGFPSKAAFNSIVTRLVRSGVDMLEIGIPFSDPVADGTTIQRASQKALENGVTIDWIFRNVKTLRNTVSVPLVFMTYLNPIIALGLDKFFGRARAVGIDGVIIPDLTPEEGKPIESVARRYGLHLIYLATPNTPLDRLKLIARATRGFLYAVSLTGVTGARRSLPSDVVKFLGQLRKVTRKPVAIGFGISTPDHVRSLRRSADGVIVGSALIHHLESSVAGTERFVSSLQKALNPNSKEPLNASS